MAGLGATEILIILLVVLLLFGSTKLPQLARSLGRSARILRAETQGLHDDEPGDRPAPSAPRASEAEHTAYPRDAAYPHEEDARPRPRASLPPARPLRGTPVRTSDTRPAP